MKIRQNTALLVATLLLFALAACGKKGAESPSEAFKSFYQAAKEKDVETLKNVMSKQSLAGMEREATARQKSLEDHLATEAQKGLPPTMPELSEEKIDGNQASLQFKSDKATIPSTVYFVKEDGYWKIDIR